MGECSCSINDYDAPTRQPQRWRTWRAASKMAGWFYVLGIASGSCWASSGGVTAHVHQIYYRHRRVYLFGWPKEYWACIFQGRHWPHPVRELGSFGCGRCMPWSCCGSIETDHKPECEEMPA